MWGGVAVGCVMLTLRLPPSRAEPLRVMGGVQASRDRFATSCGRFSCAEDMKICKREWYCLKVEQYCRHSLSALLPFGLRVATSPYVVNPVTREVPIRTTLSLDDTVVDVPPPIVIFYALDIRYSFAPLNACKLQQEFSQFAKL